MKRALAIAVTAGLIGAGAASGAVAPLFDRASARVGERVTVRSGYAGTRPSGIVVYLIRLADVPRLFHVPYSGLPEPLAGPPPRDKRLHRLGSLRAAANGAGTMTFSVPDLSPARYTLVVWCKPCAPPRGDHWWMAAPNYVTNARAVLRITRK